MSSPRFKTGRHFSFWPSDKQGRQQVRLDSVCMRVATNIDAHHQIGMDLGWTPFDPQCRRSHKPLAKVCPRTVGFARELRTIMGDIELLLLSCCTLPGTKQLVVCFRLQPQDSKPMAVVGADRALERPAVCTETKRAPSARQRRISCTTIPARAGNATTTTPSDWTGCR